MTSRRQPEINLDIQIQRPVTTFVPNPGTITLRYAQGQFDGMPGAGSYRYVDRDNFWLGATDSDGVVIPAGTNASSLRLVGRNTFNQSFTDNVTLASFTDLTTYFVAVRASGDLFTETTAELNVTIPVAGEVEATTRTVWATRRDFAARDLIATSEAGPVTVEDSRFIVRAGIEVWTEGDLFTVEHEHGAPRIVRGVSRIGRGQYLELLARIHRAKAHTLGVTFTREFLP